MHYSILYYTTWHSNIHMVFHTRIQCTIVHSTEELAVAKDAIANLRVSFGEADPNQHMLDTLEQCVSVIVEKLVKTELFSRCNTIFTAEEKNLKCFNSMVSRVSQEAGQEWSLLPPPHLKPPRSVTPFMSR